MVDTAQSKQTQSISFDEISEVINAAPVIEKNKHEFTIEPEGISLPPRIHDLLSRIADIQDKQRPSISRPRVALYAADHAIHEQCQALMQMPSALQYIKEMENNDHAIGRMCFLSDAELRLYELDPDNPAKNFMTGDKAMDAQGALHAMTYGMMAVEPGVDMLVLGGLGKGHDIAGRALTWSLFPDKIEDKEKWFSDLGVTEALETNKDQDAFASFCHFASYPMAAMVGGVLAARLARIPVLIDSEAALAVLAFLQTYRQDIVDHCFYCDLLPQEWKNTLPQIGFIETDVIHNTPYSSLMFLSQLQNYMALLPALHGVNVHMA